MSDRSDELLDADIRLLGRVLGDVIRAQAGTPTFELIERVRRASVGSRMMGRDPADELSTALRDPPIRDLEVRIGE